VTNIHVPSGIRTRYPSSVTTVVNNRKDVIIFDKTIKVAYLTDVASPLSHSLLGTITETLQKYITLKENLSILWQIKAVYIITLALSVTDIIPHKLHDSWKLLGLRPGLYISSSIN
jgi:hypothetical protein